MSASDVVEALRSLRPMATLLPAPVGPIVMGALDLAIDLVELEQGDPVAQLEELRGMLRSGINDDWRKRLG